MRESIPMLQESKIPRDALIGMLAAAPDITGSGTFGTKLHADGIAGMAGSLLEVDATVLDGVLSGTIESFLDSTAPFAVPSLVICADPASPDAVADPKLARHFADLMQYVGSSVLRLWRVGCYGRLRVSSNPTALTVR